MHAGNLYTTWVTARCHKQGLQSIVWLISGCARWEPLHNMGDRSWPQAGIARLKLHAQVYDILFPTTGITGYVIGLLKLPAKWIILWPFFLDARMAVSLQPQTNCVRPHCSYSYTHNQCSCHHRYYQNLSIESKLIFYPGWTLPMSTCVLRRHVASSLFLLILFFFFFSLSLSLFFLPSTSLSSTVLILKHFAK